MPRDTYDMFGNPERGRFGENESSNSRVTNSSDLVDLLVALHHETERAVLISIDGDEYKAQWIPKSRCEIEHTKHSPISGHRKSGQAVRLPCVTLTLSDSLAVEKGLI